MNFTLIIMLFLFMQLMNKGSLNSLLENPSDLLSLANVFSEKNADLSSLLTNPIVGQMLSQLFFKQESPQCKSDTPMQERPSKEAQDFFTPAKTVAGKEVYNKLCTFYDNWYVKS
ncbi:MAG: hypothetical protein J6R37_01795 [Clostridia bacterium]|nr:hypothetical protein [Clostridia bacterium]